MPRTAPATLSTLARVRRYYGLQQPGPLSPRSENGSQYEPFFL